VKFAVAPSATVTLAMLRLGVVPATGPQLAGRLRTSRSTGELPLPDCSARTRQGTWAGRRMRSRQRSSSTRSVPSTDPLVALRTVTVRLSRPGLDGQPATVFVAPFSGGDREHSSLACAAGDTIPTDATMAWHRNALLQPAGRSPMAVEIGHARPLVDRSCLSPERACCASNPEVPSSAARQVFDRNQQWGATERPRYVSAKSSVRSPPHRASGCDVSAGNAVASMSADCDNPPTRLGAMLPAFNS
jgi:hypothetical protein